MFDDKTVLAMVDVTGTMTNKAANKTGSNRLDDDTKRFMTILFSSRGVENLVGLLRPPPVRKRPKATKCRIGKNAHQSTLARTNRHTGAHELTRGGDESGPPVGTGGQDHRRVGPLNPPLITGIRTLPRLANRAARPLHHLCG
jgi:hypothetical protein